uniref:Uncharacterized protein n=1 Tax=Desertifilum tharense IPPAS B-1220 TaxID=1781255 RepID=A0ACD5GWK2_9CYAN
MLKGWLKSFLTLGVLLFLGFVLFGDRILPQPMSQYQRQYSHFHECSPQRLIPGEETATEALRTHRRRHSTGNRRTAITTGGVTSPVESQLKLFSAS